MISISPSSCKRKARDSNPQPQRGGWLAPSFLANSDTFRMSVDRPGIEPGFPPRQGGVVPLDHQPVQSVDLMGVEPIAVRVQTQLAPIGMQAQVIKRSVRELNPAFFLTTEACGRNTYRPFFFE